jgi:hypothetical protein
MKNHFHGTRSDILAFNFKGSGKHGIGFYFAASFQEARSFACTLAGNGDRGEPRVYTVKLKVRRAFDTMNADHAQEVAQFYGFQYRVARFAGGPKEHYHHLVNQMVRRGICKKAEVNEVISKAGFDAIYCDFFEHTIALFEDQIEIVSKEMVD